jgi:serine phosphatase RsbU (regulator of sigma subunit)/ligand-binding sensor domain-containing protein
MKTSRILHFLHPHPGIARIVYLVFLLAGGATGTVCAQHRIPFQNLTVRDGLSQMFVSAAVQDAEGFLWFGTKDGLNRFDGNRFKIYRHHPFDTTSLSDSHVRSLAVDGSGRLWIGTTSWALNLYDFQRDRFHRFSLSAAGEPDDLPADITAIVTDGDGVLWLGTAGRGLIRFEYRPSDRSPQTTGSSRQASAPDPDPAEVSIARIRYSAHCPDGLSSDTIRCLAADPANGRLWIGTDAGLDCTDTRQWRHAGGGPASGAQPVFIHHGLFPTSAQFPVVSALHLDAGGTLWAGSGSGLFHRARMGDRFIHQPYPSPGWQANMGTIRALAACPPEPGLPAGTIWLGAVGGAAVYDPATGTFAFHRHDPADPSSLGGRSVQTILRDRGGVIWLGSNGGGISVMDPATSRFRTLDAAIPAPDDATRTLRRLSIRSICESTRRERALWIGADAVYRLDRTRGTCRRFPLAGGRADTAGTVFSILEDRRGRIWFGTGQGLYGYDPETRRRTYHPTGLETPDGGADNRVLKLLEDRTGRLWLVTGRSLGWLDEASGRIHHIWYDLRPPNRFEQPRFPPLWEDESGRMWLGTPAGLLRLDPASGKLQQWQYDPARSDSLSSNQVMAIEPDPQEGGRLLWIGTGGGGLSCLDRSTGRFVHLLEQDGLPSNYIYGILPDRDGRFWISTNKGLSCFNPRTLTFHNFDAGDGLQGDEFNAGAYFRSLSGELFFGGLSGLNAFHPRDIRTDPYVPPVVFTGLQINSLDMSHHAAHNRLPQPVNQLEELRLAHTDRVVSFEVAALSYSARHKNRFAYKLENFDPRWIAVGTHRRITFTNLDPGTYRLVVRGANHDGVWNTTGKAIRLVVMPPPWRSWWAYGLYAGAALILLYAVRRYELGRLRLKYRLYGMEQEMRLAVEIQQMFLTRVSPDIPGYDIAQTSLSSRPVGGDYLDAFPLDEGGWAICVGDVAGKGLPAALIMANLHAVIRSQARLSGRPSESLTRANRMLCETIESGQFVTLFFGVLDPAGHRLHFCNAGHVNPYLCVPSAEPHVLETGGLVLGFLKETRYEDGLVPLPPGALLVLYSDGVSEAFGPDGQEFGRDRLIDTVRRHQDQSAARILEAVLEAVRQHLAGRPAQDDMTLMVIRRPYDPAAILGDAI